MPGRHCGPCASCGIWCAWVAAWLFPRFTAIAAWRTRTVAALVAVATRRVVLFFLADLGKIEDLALVDPHLDADDSVGGLSFSEAVIDVGAQRMQRHAAFAVPLRTRDLG